MDAIKLKKNLGVGVRGAYLHCSLLLIGRRFIHVAVSLRLI